MLSQGQGYLGTLKPSCANTPQTRKWPPGAPGWAALFTTSSHGVEGGSGVAGRGTAEHPFLLTETVDPACTESPGNTGWGGWGRGSRTSTEGQGKVRQQSLL